MALSDRGSRRAVRRGGKPGAQNVRAPKTRGAKARRGGAPPRTTLYRLHCFEVVVQEAGFKRATARLHITQPALSYQIKQLEEELDAQLFYRRPGGVSTTEAGRVLFEHVQRVSAAVSHARRAMQQLSEGAAGEVRIGTVNSVGVYFLPRLLWTMRERYPATRPTVTYRQADEIVASLLATKLDVAILADPPFDRRLCYEPLFGDPVSLVSGRSHRFFGSPIVLPEQLRDEQFVSLSPRTPTGALIGAYLDRLGVANEPMVSTDNVETVKRMVEIGMGIAFLPNMVTESDVASRERPEGRLGRSLVDPGLVRRIVLVTWDGSRPSRAVATFLDEVRKHGKQWACGLGSAASFRRSR
jgi:LysR family hydrogen peroxide-inducible transcriptional activator